MGRSGIKLETTTGEGGDALEVLVERCLGASLDEAIDLALLLRKLEYAKLDGLLREGDELWSATRAVSLGGPRELQLRTLNGPLPSSFESFLRRSMCWRRTACARLPANVGFFFSNIVTCSCRAPEVSTIMPEKKGV